MFRIEGRGAAFVLLTAAALALTAGQTQAQCQNGNRRQSGSQQLTTQSMNASLLNTTQTNALLTALQQQQMVAQQQQLVVQLNALVPALQQQQAALQTALQRTTDKLTTLQDDSTTSAVSLKAVQRRQTKLQNALQQNAALLQQLTGQPAGFQGVNNVGALFESRKIPPRLRRFFDLNVDGREVFVVAGGVERFNAQHIDARLFDGKERRAPTRHFGFKLSVNCPSVTVPLFKSALPFRPALSSGAT